MKKLELEQMEKIEGGKFWGTGTVEVCTPNPLGTGNFCQTCSQDYYFWISAGEPYNCKDTTGPGM